MKFHISHPRYWGTISYKQVVEEGGYKLISLYSHSVQKMVKALFPGFSFYETELNYTRSRMEARMVYTCSTSQRLLETQRKSKVISQRVSRAIANKTPRRLGKSIKQAYCSIWREELICIVWKLYAKMPKRSLSRFNYFRL